jgi:selenocysteine lyase/cysteine desulfurase
VKKWKKMIYVDNSATTAVSEKALLAMLPYFRENYGNPSSIHSHSHSHGQKAQKALENSRHTVASAIGAYNNPLFLHLILLSFFLSFHFLGLDQNHGIFLIMV